MLREKRRFLEDPNINVTASVLKIELQIMFHFFRVNYKQKLKLRSSQASFSTERMKIKAEKKIWPSF